MVNPKNIMIVEDEVITQRYLKDILHKNNMDIVGCFDNGKDALDALKHVQCDLMLLDINLKGDMDGLRVAKRALEAHHVCIVFITAYGDNDTLEEALELSSYGFVIKPFTPQEIEISMAIAYKRFLLNTETSKENSPHLEDNIYLGEALTYSTVHATLSFENKPVPLSIRQTKLVALLARNVNEVVPNEVIIAEVWGDKIVKSTSLRTLVYSIRKLVPELSIISHSKVGYMIKSHH